MLIKWQRSIREGGREWRQAAVPVHVMTLVDVVGLTAAALLIEHYGGRMIIASRNPRPGSAIATLIGQEPAKALGHEFMGSRCQVPRATAFLTQWLRSTERASIAQIAGRVGCHERSVTRHLSAGVLVDD